MNIDTRSLLLREAEFLIRTRGYSAFSYADLAERAAITKASVHYYFPSKEDLISVLLEEYITAFLLTLENIRQQHPGAGERLRAYGHLFLVGFERGMLPLCGALSAERSALPESLRPRVHYFFQIQLDWLNRVLQEGVAEGSIGTAISPVQMAVLLLSTLEGGSFVGWALTNNETMVLSAFESTLRSLEAQNPMPLKRRAPRPKKVQL